MRLSRIIVAVTVALSAALSSLTGAAPAKAATCGLQISQPGGAQTDLTATWYNCWGWPPGVTGIAPTAFNGIGNHYFYPDLCYPVPNGHYVSWNIEPSDFPAENVNFQGVTYCKGTNGVIAQLAPAGARGCGIISDFSWVSTGGSQFTYRNCWGWPPLSASGQGYGLCPVAFNGSGDYYTWNTCVEMPPNGVPITWVMNAAGSPPEPCDWLYAAIGLPGGSIIGAGTF